MKAKTLIPILLLLISGFTYGQDKKLMIIVDTDIVTQENINESCKFEGQQEGTNITDFITEVSMDDEVKWKIKRKDGSKGSVKLIKFKHERGPRFFQEDEIPEKNGRIKGVVKSDALGTEKYTIEIKVKKQHESVEEVYSIDPKLKFVPRD